MIKDRYGNNLSTNSQTAADLYIDAVDRFLAADSRVDATFQRAIDEDENFALAHLAPGAYTHLKLPTAPYVGSSGARGC